MRIARENILVQMIEVRRRTISWLRRPKPARKWPMFELWRSPEATALDTIESFRWIRDSGLNDQPALETLATRIGVRPSRELDADFTIRELVVSRLKIEHPSYSSIEAKTLDRQLEIADSWVLNEIQLIKSKRSFPPIEWLEKRVDIDEIGAGSSGDWNRLKMFLTERDELWTFSSPPDYWAGLAGRAGVALVRNGRPIAHVITVMN
jgi:hypothetical protein